MSAINQIYYPLNVYSYRYAFIFEQRYGNNFFIGIGWIIDSNKKAWYGFKQSFSLLFDFN